MRKISVVPLRVLDKAYVLDLYLDQSGTAIRFVLAWNERRWSGSCPDELVKQAADAITDHMLSSFTWEPVLVVTVSRPGSAHRDIRHGRLSNGTSEYAVTQGRKDSGSVDIDTVDHRVGSLSIEYLGVERCFPDGEPTDGIAGSSVREYYRHPDTHAKILVPNRRILVGSGSGQTPSLGATMDEVLAKGMTVTIVVQDTPSYRSALTSAIARLDEISRSMFASFVQHGFSMSQSDGTSDVGMIPVIQPLARASLPMRLLGIESPGAP